MSKEDFTTGDVVQLKSGSPRLTVAGYVPSQSAKAPGVGEALPKLSDTSTVRVRWFTSDGMLHEAKLEPSCLELAECPVHGKAKKKE